jgi:xanthine dehydrogenase YagS FAD-binding subunit
MNRFSLVRLATVAEARARVVEDPAARVFRAGGIDLLDRMKEGLEEPDQLIELAAIASEEGHRLRGIGQDDRGQWRIGALVTLAQIAGFDDLPEAHAALRQAAGSAATPGIRNAATLGGNLLQRPRCWYYRHADLQCLKKGGVECLAVTGDNRYNAILGGGPSFIVHPSSLACALVALNAKVEVLGATDTRELDIDDLFVAPTVDPEREHDLRPGEILASVSLPAPLAGQRSAYAAAKEKQSHDWPLAEACVRCSVVDGRLQSVRIALGHVAPTPWPCPEVAEALEGQAPSAELFENVAGLATRKARALAHNGYKIPLVQGLLRQALHEATGVPIP